MSSKCEAELYKLKWVRHDLVRGHPLAPLLKRGGREKGTAQAFCNHEDSKALQDNKLEAREHLQTMVDLKSQMSDLIAMATSKATPNRDLQWLNSKTTAAHL